ncbi:4Fe-4S dicluster domain-containing protein [Raoultibacter phocaeensis]|uniref:4Fe-4S dicluster domain-containing protein n=1 Tax=Raoultibacter phocaeensis TaxID=2479841 RepID=UPI00111BB5E2|nr:4Fe-4S dicluster domain-containing protein [Raoultibacter phocaeensis]
MTKYGFAINLHRCIGCRTCSISCKMENSVADGLLRMRVLNDEEKLVYDIPTGAYPKLSMTWTPVPCQHCDTAPCVAVCPTGASQKREDGIVTIDKELCTGCKSCIEACPYDARMYDEASNTVDKCTLCAHRIDAGLGTTMCEIACPGRAIAVGDLDDPDSGIAKIVAEHDTIRLLEDEETGPNVYYWDSMA